MGRVDALIAAISGTTLLAFFGFVLYAVLAAVGVFESGGVSASDGGGYGPGPILPDRAAPEPSVATFERQSATLDGEQVSYLDFGAHTPLSADGNVSVAPIWVFINGFDEDGTPRMIPDHPTILDVVVGDEGYSDLWDVQFVVVPDGVATGWIRSIEDLRASGLETIPAGMLVNCPLVEEDATTSEGHEVRRGWYRGEQIHYFDLGVSAIEAGAVYEFVPVDDPTLLGYATPAPLSVPPLVELPVVDGPAAHFFRRYEVEVNDAATAEAIKSVADLEAGGFWIRATGELVNRPLLAD